MVRRVQDPPLQELSEVERLLRTLRPRTVLVQVPTALQDRVTPYLTLLENLGTRYVLSGSPTWGPCDVDVTSAVAWSADLVLHLGHWWYGSCGGVQLTHVRGIPVLYAPLYYGPEDLRWRESLEVVLDHVPQLYEECLIVTTQQYYLLTQELVSELTRCGCRVLNPTRLVFMGCELQYLRHLTCSGGRTCVLVVSGGHFHVVGTRFWVRDEVPVLHLDPHRGELREVRDEEVRRFLQLKLYHLLRQERPRRVAVLTSVKVGQWRPHLAREVLRYLEKRGVRAQVLTYDDVPIEYLSELPYDLYVVTACPRIALDDVERCRTPLILPVELPFYLGEVPLSQYLVYLRRVDYTWLH